MFLSRKKGNGNIFTLISIIMIIAVIYMFRPTLPQTQADFPDTVTYNNLRYKYIETLKSSPIMFVRKKPISDEGFIVLARRGISAGEEIYIYEGSKKYRHYKVLKE